MFGDKRWQLKRSARKDVNIEKKKDSVEMKPKCKKIFTEETLNSNDIKSLFKINMVNNL